MPGVGHGLRQLRLIQPRPHLSQYGCFIRRFARSLLGVSAQGHGGAVGIIDKQPADFLRKVPLRRLVLERLQRILEMQRFQRVSAMQPIAQGVEHVANAARHRAGVVFAQRELERIGRRCQLIGAEPFLGDLFERLENERLDLAGISRVNALHAKAGHGLAQSQTDPTTGHPLAQPAFGQGLAQGCCGIARQQIAQHAMRQRFGTLRRRIDHPVDRHHAVPRLARFLGTRIGTYQLPRRVEPGLQPHFGVNLDALKLAEICVQDGQALIRRVVARKERPRIGGVIVNLMKALELLVGEVRDRLGVTARALAISRVRIERALRQIAHHRIGGRKRTLHLIEHDALVDQRRRAIIELIVPAFLPENVFGQQRKEHRVEIHIDQVVEILEVLAGHRISGLVRKGHGVEERILAALEQFHERLLDRIFPAPAQYRVLKNMGNAGRVLRGRLERHPEHLVLIVVDQAQHLCPGLFVPEQLHLRIDLRNMLVADQFEGFVIGHEITRQFSIVRQQGREPKRQALGLCHVKVRVTARCRPEFPAAPRFHTSCAAAPSAPGIGWADRWRQHYRPVVPACSPRR